MSDKMVRVIDIFIQSFLPMLKAGIAFTVPLTILSFALGLLLAFITAIVRVTNLKILSSIAKFYVWIIRGTPLLVQLFIIFYGLPSVGLTINAFVSAVIGFTISVGAYNSETIRAAILSISKGQWEAAQALGMSKFLTLRRIIIPQAVRVAVPPLANSFISLLKDTSLAAAITVTEMFQVSQQITARTYEPLLLYCEVAIIYLIFSSILSLLQNHTELKFAKHINR
jgi:L-cystine transport system permease protein